jgi:hypothetical protein
MPSLISTQRRFFIGRDAMNYPAFTNDSLTMMYEGIRGALAADDALKRQGMEIRFRVRETPEWRLHAAELETEMLGRGMMLEVIDWSGIKRRHRFECSRSHQQVFRKWNKRPCQLIIVGDPWQATQNVRRLAALNRLMADRPKSFVRVPMRRG